MESSNQESEENTEPQMVQVAQQNDALDTYASKQKEGFLQAQKKSKSTVHLPLISAPEYQQQLTLSYLVQEFENKWPYDVIVLKRHLTALFGVNFPKRVLTLKFIETYLRPSIYWNNFFSSIIFWKNYPPNPELKLYEQLEDPLRCCSICFASALNGIVEEVWLNCGHMFCLKCVLFSIQKHYQNLLCCSMCKRPSGLPVPFTFGLAEQRKQTMRENFWEDPRFEMRFDGILSKEEFIELKFDNEVCLRASPKFKFFTTNDLITQKDYLLKAQYLEGFRMLLKLAEAMGWENRGFNTSLREEAEKWYFLTAKEKEFFGYWLQSLQLHTRRFLELLVVAETFGFESVLKLSTAVLIHHPDAWAIVHPECSLTMNQRVCSNMLWVDLLKFCQSFPQHKVANDLLREKYGKEDKFLQWIFHNDGFDKNKILHWIEKGYFISENTLLEFCVGKKDSNNPFTLIRIVPPSEYDDTKTLKLRMLADFDPSKHVEWNSHLFILKLEDGSELDVRYVRALPQYKDPFDYQKSMPDSWEPHQSTFSKGGLKTTKDWHTQPYFGLKRSQEQFLSLFLELHQHLWKTHIGRMEKMTTTKESFYVWIVDINEVFREKTFQEAIIAKQRETEGGYFAFVWLTWIFHFLNLGLKVCNGKFTFLEKEGWLVTKRVIYKIKGIKNA